MHTFKKARALSSVGSEHLPYKQRVAGSNPAVPTVGIAQTVPIFYMQYFVYILYSKILDRYYIGSTSDLQERLKKNNRNHKGYTNAGKPWVIIYYETFETKADALRREKQLKAWKNRQKIELLLNQVDYSSAGAQAKNVSEHPD